MMGELLRGGCDGHLGVMREILRAGCDGELFGAECDGELDVMESWV